MSSIAIPESDLKDLAITPVFKWIEVENIHQSEHTGYPVMETREVVELHIAGKTNCVHVANVTDFCRRDGNRMITYAEEYSAQYQAFKQGHPQEAQGSPLEMLRSFGVSPAMISLCRARNIYSIEALHQMEGPALKSLGIEANSLKEAASKFMAERTSKIAALSENASLREELEQLKARLAAREACDPVVDDAYADLSDDEIKEQIAQKVGARPRGNPSRSTLVGLLDQALAA